MNTTLESKIEHIEKIGKTIEAHFCVPPEQKEYYLNLYDYFSKNDCPWDLNKGLLISGGIGVGKTLSMKIMQNIFGNFKIESARHLVREYLIDGVKVIDTYGRKSFVINPQGNIDIKKPVHYCFDDILLEEVNAKFYGNQQNLMAEVLLDRYDMFIRHGMRTFATTNAVANMIEESYGARVRDRIREMCNVVTLLGETFRK